MAKDYFVAVIKVFLLLIASLFLLRIQFWVFNRSYVPARVEDFFLGIRFDLSLTGYFALFALPLFYINAWIATTYIRQSFFFVLSLCLFLPCLLTEGWDLIYFQYTLKRCSFDLYLFLNSSEESVLIWSMALRFWYVFVGAAMWFSLYSFCVLKIVKKIDFAQRSSPKILHFGSAMLCAFILARGSYGIRPLGILDANVFDEPTRSQLVLNSPFVVLKTLHNKPLANDEYLNRSTEEKLFNPAIRYEGNCHANRPNLVFIVLESFGAAQLGDTLQGIPLTPFLDSLCHKDTSTLFCKGISNGKTSIECLPAIFAGIPSLLESPFMLSNYSNNELLAFPKIARLNGYSTLFFHGAGEGSMRFGATAMHLGFEQLFFKPNIQGKSAEMGSWGYHDRAVFRKMLRVFKETKGPFLGTVFSLSSHEPYDLPSSHIARYPELPKEASAYRYTDDCLKEFFQAAKKEQWFSPTIFIITGDHTPVHLDNSAYSIDDYYSVPIAVVNSSFQREPPKEHINIVPWLIECLGWKANWYGYGNDLNGDRIRYLNGVYHVWNPRYHLQFNERLGSWKLSSSRMDNSIEIEHSKKRFLAILQRFRRDLRFNKLRN